MPTDLLRQKHIPQLSDSIQQLQKFGGLTTAEVGPEYHGLLGTVTNATMCLLEICIVKMGESTPFSWQLNEGQWESLMVMTHRAFYASILTSVEGMCDGFCGHNITPCRIDRKPEFMDYVNSALKLSSMNESQKTFWRKYFDGLRILRNKASHYDVKFTDQEKNALKDAGLEHHISPQGTIHSNTSNYAPIAQKIYDFMQELERSRIHSNPPSAA